MLPRAQPILSLVMPALLPRFAEFTLPMLMRLQAQIAAHQDVELLMYADNGEASIGYKMNCLVQNARGKYIAGLGDDDMVAQDYLDEIVPALKKHKPDVLIFQHDYYVNGEWTARIFEDLSYPQNQPNDSKTEYFRRVDNKMPIKAELVKAYTYEDKSQGEDTSFAVWFCKRKHGLTQHKIDRVLYHYWYRNNNKHGLPWRRQHT